MSRVSLLNPLDIFFLGIFPQYFFYDLLFSANLLKGQGQSRTFCLLNIIHIQCCSWAPPWDKDWLMLEKRFLDHFIWECSAKSLADFVIVKVLKHINYIFGERNTLVFLPWRVTNSRDCHEVDIPATTVIACTIPVSIPHLGTNKYPTRCPPLILLLSYYRQDFSAS